MATETAISNHTSATDEQVEKVSEGVKAIEHDGVSSSKESLEEEKPKVEESPSPATPLSKAEELSDDKQIEPPIAKVEKTDDAPASDVPVDDKTVEKDSIPDSHTTIIPQPVADNIDTQPEEQPAVESVVEEAPEQPAVVSVVEEAPEQQAVASVVEKAPEQPVVASLVEEAPEQPAVASVVEEAPEQPAVASVVEEAPEQLAVASLEKEPEEKANIVEVPEQIRDAAEKLEEPLDALPPKEPGVVGIEEIKSPHEESIKVEEPEAAAIEAEEKPGEPSEYIEKTEKKNEAVDTKETVDVDTEKDTGTSAEKVETTFSKGTEEEPSVIRSSEQVQTNQDALTSLREDEGEFSLPSSDAEKVEAEDKKELSGADEIGELSKDAVVEAGKVAEKNEEKTVETGEGNGKINVIPEESTTTVKEKDISTSISAAEVVQKSIDEKSTGRDVEEENEVEQNEETLALGGTNKDEVREEKQAQVTPVDSKPLEEPQKSELQVKNEENIETSEEKLEKETVDEIANLDGNNAEPSVNASDETKTSQDLPKELPAKSTQKQSNNIISKVKQSLVKAKKAIIGKSPNSKTLSSDAKGDIKVK